MGGELEGCLDSSLSNRNLPTWYSLVSSGWSVVDAAGPAAACRRGVVVALEVLLPPYMEFCDTNRTEWLRSRDEDALRLPPLSVASSAPPAGFLLLGTAFLSSWIGKKVSKPPIEKNYDLVNGYIRMHSMFFSYPHANTLICKCAREKCGFKWPRKLLWRVYRKWFGGNGFPINHLTAKIRIIVRSW